MSRLIDTLTIVNERGLHARAASSFVNVASRYSSVITVQKDAHSVDGKSILGVVSLLGVRGTRIVVTVEGDDAHEALGALRQLVAYGFKDEAPR